MTLAWVWNHIDVRGKYDCWPALMASGRVPEHLSQYGSVNVGSTVVAAHRLVAMMEFGEIPAGNIVCHHCDHRACANPAHLYIGTGKTNARDTHRSDAYCLRHDWKTRWVR